jgi:hypothetical protein
MTNTTTTQGDFMIHEIHDGKTYRGKTQLDIAMQVADDRADAIRQARRYNRTPKKSDKCSERSNIFRL